MFAYNPTVNNQAGSILGAGQASAAATNAQAQTQLGGDIASSLLMVAKAYTDNETAKTKGKAFLNTLGVLAPAMGINEEQLKQIKSSFKTPQEAAMFGDQVLSFAPSMINYNMAGLRPGNQMATATHAGNVRTITEQNSAVTEGDAPAFIPKPQASAWGKSYTNLKTKTP
jgi:hypothetical protein